MESSIIALITALMGGVVGTFCGAYVLYRFQNRKWKKVREIAIEGLNIFEQYAKKNGTYADAANEFNLKLDVVKKRAVLVALHKLGIPVDVLTRKFNIHSINFQNVSIDKNAIRQMKFQIKEGLCDNMFYQDVESYFLSNLRLQAVRNVGVKYVKEVLMRSSRQGDKIVYPDVLGNMLAIGEYYAVAVFRSVILEGRFFDNSGKPIETKMEELIHEIEIGLFDNYLLMDIEVYTNVVAQRQLATDVNSMIHNNINNNANAIK